MNETEVVAAFLDEIRMECPTLRTDGERLYLGDTVIAEWSPDGLRILPQEPGSARKDVRDELLHAVVFHMTMHQLAGNRVTMAAIADA